MFLNELKKIIKSQNYLIRVRKSINIGAGA